MRTIKISALAFLLLLLSVNYAKAADPVDKMVQTDFSKAYTGLENTTIISSKPKDCDFQVSQASKNYTSIFDKTAQTGTDQKAKQ